MIKTTKPFWNLKNTFFTVRKSSEDGKEEKSEFQNVVYRFSSAKPGNIWEKKQLRRFVKLPKVGVKHSALGQNKNSLSNAL